MDIIKKYFPFLSPLQQKQFEDMGELYRYWNERINVVSRRDIDHIYENHILHSLAIAKIINFKPGTKIVDVGCGGGFPGIPLAVMFPEVSFTMVDSIGKKIKVVQEVSNSLGLTNVYPVNARIEAVNDKFDFVVSRAVTDMSSFWQWVENKIVAKGSNDLQNGVIYLKGGNLNEEMKPFVGRYKTYNIKEFFEEEFFEEKKIVYLPK